MENNGTQWNIIWTKVLECNDIDYYVFETLQKEFCNASLNVDISLVTTLSYLNLISLKFLLISLHNEVQLAMIMYSWNFQYS